MNVKVLFFGATAEITGTRELDLSTQPGDTVGAVVERLSSEHPALGRRKLLLAVNEEYAGSDTKLNDGDEVAVFTAVSGG